MPAHEEIYGGPLHLLRRRNNSLGEAYDLDIGESKVPKLDLSGTDAHEVELDVEGTIDNIDLATGDTSPVIVALDYSDRVSDAFFPFRMMPGVDVTDRWIYVFDGGVVKFRRRR